jgi:hypothetical protein
VELLKNDPNGKISVANIAKDKAELYSLEFLITTVKNKMTNLKAFNDFNSGFADIMLRAGLSFMVLGGVLWYLLIQRFQDKILKIQTSQLEHNMNNNSKIIGRVHFEPKILPKRFVKDKTTK